VPLTVGIECESLEGDSWGVARMTRKLLEHLSVRSDLKGRWQFMLYFKRKVPADIAALDPDVFTAKVIGVSSFSLYYYIALPFRLWRDRTLAMYYPNYMLPILHPPSVRSVVMLTEDIYREMRNPRLLLRYRLAYRLFAAGWAARHATKILAISRSSRDALAREGIPPERIAVNTLAIGAPSQVAKPEQSDVLFVGQAFERRHLRETLAAFAVLVGEFPNLTMRIIGPDKYDPPFVADAIRNLNSALKRTAVRWDAQVPEDVLAAAYAGARCLVYVSDAEAFGLPPLEALSYHVVPVVSDAPVTREIFGTHASYAADGGVESIAEAIRRAFTDASLRARITAAAPGIIARYRWDAHAERFLELMTSLCTVQPA
jgi:glycosyltransferase involved in cell wall biosynthesis